MDKVAKETLYMHLSKLLEFEIASGKFTSGELLPSERALCKFHKLSHTTVRLALKELEIRNLICRIPGKGTFVSNLTIGNKIAKVGIIVENSANLVESPFMTQLIAGIKNRLQKNHVNYMQIPYNHGDCLELIKQKVLRGLIIFNPLWTNEIWRSLQQYKIPIVTVGHTKLEKQPSIDSDNFSIGYELTKYLLLQGYRKIGFIGFNRELPLTKDRLAGYKQALREFGLSAKLSWIVYRDYHGKIGEDEAEFLYNSGVDAIFCLDDVIAVKAMDRLQNRGISVPQQVGVVGCNDSLLSQYYQPHLTTADVFPEKIGEEAANKLCDLLNNIPVEMHTIIKSQIRIRDSALKNGFNMDTVSKQRKLEGIA